MDLSARGERHISHPTRYLTEGVYLDPDFRDRVIRDVHNASHRRVPPSHGFDLIPVVEHAWRAWVLAMSLRFSVLAVLVIGFVSNAPATVLVISCAGLWYAIPLALRATVSAVRLKARALMGKLMRRAHLGNSSELLRQVRLVLLSTGLCLALVAVPVLVAHGMHVRMTEAIPAAGLLLSLIIAVCVAVGVIRYLWVRQVHLAASLRPARMTRRLRTIDEHQTHPCVVYSPDVTDRFVGSGRRVYNWLPSLVVPLLRPGEASMLEREHTLAPFQAHQLVDHIRVTMASIGDPEDPARLRGFTMRDRFYVPEAAVISDRECLRTPPMGRDVVRVIDNPSDIRQHYLEISVSELREVTITVFVRVAVRGRSLTVDFSACALTATPLRFHALNDHRTTGSGAMARTAMAALRGLPQDIATMWRLVEVPWMLARALWARKDRSLVPRRRVRIASPNGIREIEPLPWQDAHLEREAVARVIKHIEQRLLVAVEEFLESMDVDTSLLADRIANIINSGVMNFGGNMQVNNSAVGAEANVQNSGSPAASGSGGQTNATAPQS